MNFNKQAILVAPTLARSLLSASLARVPETVVAPSGGAITSAQLWRERSDGTGVRRRDSGSKKSEGYTVAEVRQSRSTHNAL